MATNNTMPIITLIQSELLYDKNQSKMKDTNYSLELTALEYSDISNKTLTTLNFIHSGPSH
jgi:hypothetical protein